MRVAIGMVAGQWCMLDAVITINGFDLFCPLSNIRCLSCNRGLGGAPPTPVAKSWNPPISECVSTPAASAPRVAHGAIAPPRGPVQVEVATALLPFGADLKPPSTAPAPASARVTNAAGKARPGSASLASFAVHSRDITPITHAGGATVDEVSAPARPQSAAPTSIRAKR